MPGRIPEIQPDQGIPFTIVGQRRKRSRPALYLVDIQFVIDEDKYDQAIVALHGALIEPHNHEYAIVAASTTAG